MRCAALNYALIFQICCVKLKKKTLTCNTNYKQYSCIFQKKKNKPSSPYLTGI